MKHGNANEERTGRRKARIFLPVLYLLYILDLFCLLLRGVRGISGTGTDSAAEALMNLFAFFMGAYSAVLLGRWLRAHKQKKRSRAGRFLMTLGCCCLGVFLVYLPIIADLASPGSPQETWASWIALAVLTMIMGTFLTALIMVVTGILNAIRNDGSGSSRSESPQGRAASSGTQAATAGTSAASTASTAKNTSGSSGSAAKITPGSAPSAVNKAPSSTASAARTTPVSPAASAGKAPVSSSAAAKARAAQQAEMDPERWAQVERWSVPLPDGNETAGSGEVTEAPDHMGQASGHAASDAGIRSGTQAVPASGARRTREALLRQLGMMEQTLEPSGEKLGTLPGQRALYEEAQGVLPVIALLRSVPPLAEFLYDEHTPEKELPDLVGKLLGGICRMIEEADMESLYILWLDSSPEVLVRGWRALSAYRRISSVQYVFDSVLEKLEEQMLELDDVLDWLTWRCEGVDV